MDNTKKKYKPTRQNFYSRPRRYSDKEFARAGIDILTKYGLGGENPDKVIASKGMSYIEELERDTHLSSSLATRRAKLIKKGWRIVPASEKLIDVTKAQFVTDQLVNMQGSFEKDLEASLDAIGKGFSLTEINYQEVVWKGKRRVGLKNLRYKEPKLFSFKYDEFGYYKIMQIDPDANGVELPLDKFIHIVMGPNDENPYGRSVDAECAFWVWVKKNVAKFWAIYAEKFGMPLSMIQLPRSVKKNDTDYTAAKEILEAIQEETGIMVPEGFELSFLEATRAGEAGYERFIEICNKEISKRVFGATLISEEGKRGQGSYALGAEHSGIFEDYVVFDALVLEAAFSEQLIRPLIDYNWENTEYYPQFVFDEFDPGVFITFSQSLYNLTSVGLDIPKAWAYEKLKIPAPKEGEAVLEIKQQATGALAAGQDNKSVNSERRDAARSRFADDAELLKSFTNVDRLAERYEALMAAEYEKFVSELKKKRLAASGS